METNIKRTTMNITTYCNLKCKHCLAYIPYEREPRSIKIEEAKKNLEKYFEVVDSVEHFTVTGGEPLLNKDVCKIIEEVHKYDEKIRGSVDMVTVRRHIEGGTNRTLISVTLPPRSCRIGTCRRLSAE